MNFDEIPAYCKKAMDAAREAPGRYGGRYLARKYDPSLREDKILILDDDDFDVYKDDFELDILAQVTPNVVYPIGRARTWLNADGTVNLK